MVRLVVGQLSKLACSFHKGDKRNRRISDVSDDQRKSSSGSLNYLMNTLRPIQSDVDKYPGYYVFQESPFGNIILPVIPRSENSANQQ